MGVIGFIVLILPSFSNSTQLWKQLISQCATQRVQLRFGKHGPHAIVPEYGCINSVDCIFRNAVDKSAPDLLWQEAEFEQAAAQIDFRCPGQIQDNKVDYYKPTRKPIPLKHKKRLSAP